MFISPCSPGLFLVNARWLFGDKSAKSWYNVTITTRIRKSFKQHWHKSSHSIKHEPVRATENRLNFKGICQNEQTIFFNTKFSYAFFFAEIFQREFFIVVARKQWIWWHIKVVKTGKFIWFYDSFIIANQTFGRISSQSSGVPWISVKIIKHGSVRCVRSLAIFSANTEELGYCSRESINQKVGNDYNAAITRVTYG